MTKTETKTTKLNIYQKLLKVQEQVMGLGKDTKGFNFQYVSGSKVLSAIKPIMNEYGLLLKQEVIDAENTRQDYGTKSEILTKLTMQFTWIDVDTGEKDVSMFVANGQNGWDKGVGSALTYAERYFLLKYFHIATDEDDIDNPANDKSNEVKTEVKAGQVAVDKATNDKVEQGLNVVRTDFNNPKIANVIAYIRHNGTAKQVMLLDSILESKEDSTSEIPEMPIEQL